ncbi:hypothetical protein [Roseateles sp.]|nr:hypothetical protein [Roseateles sp.]
MNDAPQLEIIDLGDAKEQTKGDPIGDFTEVSEVSPLRQVP